MKFGLTCSKLKKALHILTSKDNPFIMIIIVNTDCQLQNHVFIMSVFQSYPEADKTLTDACFIVINIITRALIIMTKQK